MPSPRAPHVGTHRLAVVARCADTETAEHALAALRAFEPEDAAVVVRTEAGRLELHQEHQVAAGEGIVAGGAIGLVAGMLLGGPVFGALVGMGGGGVVGARDTGLDDDRLRTLGESLSTGEALVGALVTPRQGAEVRALLAGYGEVADL